MERVDRLLTYLGLLNETTKGPITAEMERIISEKILYTCSEIDRELEKK